MTAGAFGIGIALLCIFNAGHWLSAPGSKPIQADIVVALGGGGVERLQSALRLYEQGYANRILLTGLESARGQDDHHAQQWQSQFLLKRGVPPEALLFDRVSANSYQEASNTAVLMKSHRWKRALVVSDPPHLRRLAMVWQTACAHYGLEYRLIASDPPTWNASRWWYDKVWAKFVGMELLKFAYYALVY